MELNYLKNLEIVIVEADQIRNTKFGYLYLDMTCIEIFRESAQILNIDPGISTSIYLHS